LRDPSFVKENATAGWLFSSMVGFALREVEAAFACCRRPLHDFHLVGHFPAVILEQRLLRGR
jgi:hypothetical protein